MPTAESQSSALRAPRSGEPALKETEVDARVSVIHWRDCEEKAAAARSALERAADTGFADTDVVRLIHAYEDAQEEAQKAEKALGRASHVPAKERKAHEERVQRTHQRLPWLRQQRAMTESDFRNEQQDRERQRLAQETALAALERGSAAPIVSPPEFQPDLVGGAEADSPRGASRAGQNPDQEPALESRQKPATKSRPGAPARPEAGPQANRAEDTSLARGNEPVAGARKADTDKDVRPGQPGPESPQAEEQRRTNTAQQ